MKSSLRNIKRGVETTIKWIWLEVSCNGVRERKRERERERERTDLHVDVTFMLSRNLSRIFMNNKKERYNNNKTKKSHNHFTTIRKDISILKGCSCVSTKFFIQDSTKTDVQN